ncbi:MAG: hypothetical protein JSS91_11115 [Bacteroidetes bacterium]|nr:hypothetical protein [Bacteroidota bacterium]
MNEKAGFLLRTFFTIFLSISLSAFGGYLGRLTLSSSAGFEGGAVIFWYVTGGFIAGIISGIIFSGKLSRRSLISATVIAGLTAAVAAGILLNRLNNL